MKTIATYSQVGEYMIPNLEIQPIVIQGKFANLREKYLQQNKPALHGYLLLEETLADHCNEIGKKAEQMELRLIEQMVKAEPLLTEDLKVQDQLKWVGLMNNIRLSAAEIVLRELIYT